MDVGQILFEKGVLDEHQLDVLRQGEWNGTPLHEQAVSQGYASEEASLRALGDELGLDFIDLAEAEVDLALLKRVPARFIHREALFPVAERDGVLTVATCDPFNLYPLDELASQTGLEVQPALAARSEIAKLIKTHLGVGSETIEGLLAQVEDDGVELLEEINADGSELAEMIQEPSVVRLVNEILLEAIESRASDIHVESQHAGLQIRYRIDGVLHPQPVPPEISRFQAAIISRLKIMAKMNIAEKRLPQDGRIQLKAAGREVDVRVSVIPMIHGEGIVMRLLDKSRMDFSLAKLGMSPGLLKIFDELIRLPHGILLVTGPTGSGKTTTLYSALRAIRSGETKIITTEDPVEYQLEGINQIQVHPKIGLTFANSLRSILRHDPDVVLVGEIRDLETAENAIQASLTGHLVFSTLHTNDAAGAYTRLCDMGVEPFLVSSTVEAVMAQRLVRTLCRECRQPWRPDRADLPDDFPWDVFQESNRDVPSGPQSDIPHESSNGNGRAAHEAAAGSNGDARSGNRVPGVLYRPVGCRACRGVGYRGRLGIFELLVTGETIRQLAHDRASSWKIHQAARADGMRTLREDGWHKVLAGETSLDEVVRVTKGDVVAKR